MDAIVPSLPPPAHWPLSTRTSLHQYFGHHATNNHDRRATPALTDVDCNHTAPPRATIPTRQSLHTRRTDTRAGWPHKAAPHPCRAPIPTRQSLHTRRTDTRAGWPNKAAPHPRRAPPHPCRAPTPPLRSLHIPSTDTRAGWALAARRRRQPTPATPPHYPIAARGRRELASAHPGRNKAAPHPCRAPPHPCRALTPTLRSLHIPSTDT